MSDWSPFHAAVRDQLRARIAELEDEIVELRDEYAALEQENLDLIADLAEARFAIQSRHPSTRGDR